MVAWLLHVTTGLSCHPFVEHSSCMHYHIAVMLYTYLPLQNLFFLNVRATLSCLAWSLTFACVQVVDVLFLQRTVTATLAASGHSVQLLFAFEYIILSSSNAATLIKYILSMVDSHLEGRWEGKGTYVFYLDLVTDMLHLFVYCIFFIIVFMHYGLPLHLVSGLHLGQEERSLCLCEMVTAQEDSKLSCKSFGVVWLKAGLNGQVLVYNPQGRTE
jgi:hypothetical protein